jgi:heterodisulfide reductase subunit B
MIRTIIDIRDFRTNQEFKSHMILDNQNEKNNFELRHKLLEIARKKQNKYLVCSICNQSLVIAGNQKQKFFFKHYQDSDNCQIVTKGNI